MSERVLPPRLGASLRRRTPPTLTALEPFRRVVASARTDHCTALPAGSGFTSALPCVQTDPTPSSGLDPLLSLDELAEYLGVPVMTIYDWRQSGNRPCAIRVGRHLKLAVSDVRAWIEPQRESAPGRGPERG